MQSMQTHTDTYRERHMHVINLQIHVEVHTDTCRLIHEDANR